MVKNKTKIEKELDEAFEKAFEKFYQDRLLSYNNSHKMSFFRELFKPAFFDKKSLSYKATKVIAQYFFLHGIVSYQKNTIKEDQEDD